MSQPELVGSFVVEIEGIEQVALLKEATAKQRDADSVKYECMISLGIPREYVVRASILSRSEFCPNDEVPENVRDYVKSRAILKLRDRLRDGTVAGSDAEGRRPSCKVDWLKPTADEIGRAPKLRAEADIRGFAARVFEMSTTRSRA